MALSYCEVCGVLIKGGGQELPEGVICDDCFDSRQVDVPEESAMESVSTKETIQFECPYCHAVLRVSVNVGKRTNIRCPRCSETFYCEADRSVKARLEGNTTQVIQQEELLPELTPSQGFQPAPDFNSTQPLGPGGTQPMPKASGTQPMRALGQPQHMTPSTGRYGPGALGQPQHMTPSTGRLSGGAMGHSPTVIQPGSSDAHDGPDLELLPEDTKISDVRRKPTRSLGLRASDEGRLDLDTDSLKEKTRRFSKKDVEAERKRQTGRAGSERKKGGAHKPKAPAKRAASGRLGKKKGGRGTDKVQRKGGRGTDKVKRTGDGGALDKSSGTVKREKRVVAARSRADEIEAETGRRALRWGLGFAAVFVPLVLALFLARLGHRQAALVRADRPVGKLLSSAGRQSDRAVRSLNELVGGLVPDLPPERPAGVGAVSSGSQAPVTTR
jgi:hypothetical protein